MSLADVGEDDLAGLLALNRVGVERLAGEVGMPLASALLLNVATTAATLLRDEAPRGISALSGFLAWVASLAWRWQQLPVRRRKLVVAVVWLIALSGLALAVVNRQSALPLWAALLVWAVILVGAVLAAGRITLYYLKQRTRRAALPVLTAPIPALDPPPITERTPA